MKNFKKIMGGLLATIMVATSMSTMVSAKSVFNGVKVFDEGFGSNGVPTFTNPNKATVSTDKAANGAASLLLIGTTGDVTIDYPTPIDLSGIMGTEKITLKMFAEVGTSGFEIRLLDLNGNKCRYLDWGGHTVNQWNDISFKLASPFAKDEAFDASAVSQVYITLREWSAAYEYYFDDIVIGSESAMPGTGEYIAKTMRYVYKDGFDDAVTFNRQAYNFDVNDQFVENEETGDKAIQFTATGSGWRQFLAGGKSMDMSADWENTYLELNIKSTASGYINIRPTYHNGAEGGQVTVASNAYTFNPVAGADYTYLSIPMSTFADLADHKAVITGFSIQAGGACDGATVYVDDVRYVVVKEIAVLEAKMADGVVTVTTGADEGVIVIAIYEGASLVNVVTEEVPAVDPSINVTVGEIAEGQKVKVMILDSFAGITPLTNFVEL